MTSGRRSEEMRKWTTNEKRKMYKEKYIKKKRKKRRDIVSKIF